MNMAGAASSSNPLFLETRSEEEDLSPLPTSSTTPTAAASQKKKRSLPGTPNPDAEVIALSPKTLMATNRFVCEVCNKGFQREQNLQLHRRGHNLPWKLKQKSTTKEVKRKVYLCPEPTCVHHHHSRALGDLTGIKKHYSRKHGEKKYKCEKCCKKYAVQSDWKAHSKTCGTREYRCDCGTLFSRRDSFITHRAFCDALAQETARHPPSLNTIGSHLFGNNQMNLNLSQLGSSSNNIMLRLATPGAMSTEKSEQFVPSSNDLNYPLFAAQQPPQFASSSPFFMHQDHSNFQDLQSKPFHHDLMQLPDLQGNASYNTNSMDNSDQNNKNNMSASNYLMPDHRFNNANAGGGKGTNLFTVGTSNPAGLSSLYNSSNENQTSPHMSATALLQKAAQMGSTTSNTSATLLNGVGNINSSMNGANKFARSFENYQLQGLMTSLENSSSSSSSMLQGNDQQHKFGVFSGGMRNEQLQHQNVVNFGATKMNHNFSLSIEESDKLTHDFLGVGGEVVRNIGSGISHRDQQHHAVAAATAAASFRITASMEPQKMNSIPGNRNVFQ